MNTKFPLPLGASQPNVCPTAISRLLATTAALWIGTPQPLAYAENQRSAQ